jgi:hypothetical protein
VKSEKPILEDSKFICSRIKKRREPRVTVVTLKLCGGDIFFFCPFEKVSEVKDDGETEGECTGQLG